VLDPVVGFFLLGLIARLGRSDLRIPEALYEALSIYLLLAIGLKGGLQLAQQPLAQVWPVVSPHSPLADPGPAGPGAS